MKMDILGMKNMRFMQLKMVNNNLGKNEIYFIYMQIKYKVNIIVNIYG